MIASSDTDGIIKTWSSTPAPQTLATFISQGSAVTALDWVKHSERHFLYGTENGIVRLCDKDERKTVKELQFEVIYPKNEQQNLFVLSCGASHLFQDQEISTIACSPNASHCVIALTKKSTAESSLMLYDMKTMVLEHDLSEAAPISELTACVFNHNSQVDKTIKYFKRKCNSDKFSRSFFKILACYIFGC